MIDSDLGLYKPKRMGHLTLCQKFQTYFENEETNLSEVLLILIDRILNKVKEQSYELDFNTAGLFKVYCEETYPPDITATDKANGKIAFVYRSDSHIYAMWQGFEVFAEEVKINCQENIKRKIS